jgi:esterase/lipase superfamily enzyme
MAETSARRSASERRRTLLVCAALAAAICALPPDGLAQSSEPLGPRAKIGAPRQPVQTEPVVEEREPAAAAARAGSVPEPASLEPLTIFFATNRTPVPDGPRPERFENGREPFAVFGRVTVDPADDFAVLPGSIEVDEDAGVRLDAPETLAEDSRSASFAAGEEAGTPLAAFAAAASRGEADVIVYIHGAGHDFESALAEVARIALTYKRPDAAVVPLLFSYPTNGRGTPVNYFLDRSDARQSGEAMAAAFQRLVRFLAAVREDTGGRTLLMGHSLGVYTMRVGVQAVAGLGPPPEVFDVAFLMAGDEDADTLSDPEKMRPLLRLAKRVEVYFAPSDVLMWVSRLGNFRAPIGLRGPREVSGSDGFGGRPLAAVNADDFAFENDRRGHNYHWSSPRVVADGKQVFAGVPAAGVTGRVAEATRVFRIAALPGASLAAAARAPDEPRQDLYVFHPGTFATAAEQTDGTDLLDPARPELGALTVLTGLAPDAADAAREAAAALGTVEVLPGRYDGILVEAEGSTAQDFRVLLPSAAYRNAVLPGGFSQDGTPRLAHDERGRVSLALAPGLVAVVEPLPTATAEQWSGTIVLSGPPGGPYEGAIGTASITFDATGAPTGDAVLDGRRYAIAPEGDGATVTPAE